MRIVVTEKTDPTGLVRVFIAAMNTRDDARVTALCEAFGRSALDLSMLRRREAEAAAMLIDGVEDVPF